MDIEKTTDVGKLIAVYRTALEDALKASRQLNKQGVERPWITADVEVSREEYYDEQTIINNLDDKDPNRKFVVRKRIRLEIR